MCNQCIPSQVIRTAEVESQESLFADQMLNLMNSGAAALMVSIGHRTGLFDTMSTLEPADSREIAARAGLNERYVREWLGAMVTSRIVSCNPAEGTYFLPPAHAKMLTRAHEADNLATLMQYFAVLGSVEDRIVDCFFHGGGVPYAEYPRFQTVMADDSGQSVRSSLLEHILPLVPGFTDRLRAGIEVLDVGCGKGKAMILLAKHFPNSRFTGYDLSEEGIASGNAEAAAAGLTNICFIRQDAATFHETDAYDFITTFDAVHDQADPAALLRNIHRALRADGVYLMQDIDMHTELADNLEHPIGTLIYTISCMHCMTVSLAADGAGLGAAWGVELAERMVREAGFTSVEIHRLPHDIQNCYYIIRK